MTDQNEACPICLEDFRRDVYVPLINRENSCRHKFHFKCLKRATTAAVERVSSLTWPTCPLCRQKMFWFYPVRRGAFYELNYHRSSNKPRLKLKRKRVCPGVDEHFRPITPVPRHALGVGEPEERAAPAARAQPARRRVVGPARARMRAQLGAPIRTRSQVAAAARAQAQVEAEQRAGFENHAEAHVAQPAALGDGLAAPPVPEALAPAPANDVNMVNMDGRRADVNWNAFFMAAAFAVPSAIIGHSIFPF